MKILVCGDRNWTDFNSIHRRLCSFPEGTVLLHGDCRGADRIAADIGYMLKFVVFAFPADWNRYGNAAGPIRNRKMLDEKPDIVIAFHSNLQESRGTKDCVTEASRRGIAIEVITGG